MVNDRPDIFDYNNFRKYLDDFFEYRHKHDPGFTKSYVCKQLGLPNSRSYFQDIINGKILSPSKLVLFINLFKLSADEANFFRILVGYNQAIHDPQERQLLFEQLISLNRVPKKLISTKEYRYYNEWHHSVVRALLNVVDFTIDGDYNALRRNIFPAVSLPKIKQSIRLLLDLELVAINDAGRIKPTQKAISTGEYVKHEMVQQYQIQCLELAKQAILQNGNYPKRILTKTLSISENGFNHILRHIEKFNSEITSITHKDGFDDEIVCQLNLQLYTHYRKDTK